MAETNIQRQKSNNEKRKHGHTYEHIDLHLFIVVLLLWYITYYTYLTINYKIQ